MPDFTLDTFYKLLTTLKEHGYTFQTFAGFLKNPGMRVIILRHDVDARKMNSLQAARIEKELGISGTYYFRMVPQSYDEDVSKQIAELGHEIGYHYEDLSQIAGSRGQRAEGIKKAPLTGEPAPFLRGTIDGLKRLQDGTTARPHDKVHPEEELLVMAIVRFRENLAKLRRVVPVETICMHGSPLSKYDNRMLWEKYDYRDFGIIGEPYFDINFDEVFYLTDTGRRWDGDSVNIRDKVSGVGRRAPRELETKGQSDLERKREKVLAPRTSYPVPNLRFHSTFDIINAAKEKKLPDKIMLTVHPQRWDNRALPWMKELVWQNIKNLGKCIITSSMLNSV